MIATYNPYHLSISGHICTDRNNKDIYTYTGPTGYILIASLSTISKYSMLCVASYMDEFYTEIYM